MADVTKTIKSSGGDYASLDAAFAANEGLDLTVDNGSGVPGNLIFECHNFADTTQVVYISGTAITTSATYKVIVRAADDHQGKWSTSVYRLVQDSSLLYLMNLSQQYVENIRFEGIQFYQKSTSNNASTLRSAGAPTVGSTFEMDKCIIVNEDHASYAHRALRFEENNCDYYVSNCALYCNGANAASVGLLVTGNAVNVYFYNCTVDGFETPISGSTNLNNTRLKNTRVTDCTTVASHSIHADSDYNLTDNSTVPTNWGTNSIDGTDTPTIDYVDDSNATLTSRDYHLGATDDGIGAGTDLSADTDLSFTDDIDGDTRS